MTGERIDYYPTHEIAGYRVRAGRPMPFGPTLVPGGVNFSIFSNHATACTLVLFGKHAPAPLAELPIPPAFRTGNTWSITVFGLDVEEIEYGYRFDGPWDPEAGHRFNPKAIVGDPYARAIGGRDVWRAPPDWEDVYPHRSRLVFEDFDWEDDKPLELPTEDLIIYEAHVRSFTCHPSSGVKAPGTYAGLREKIPYLVELGVNCIELMPLFEFDEWENSRRHPDTGEVLLNYWGYSTLGFFAPKAGYAATGKYGMQVDELKTLVKDLHRHGIEVMLDVVFNHTAEGDHRGPTISFRGVDNKTYYMLTPEGWYYNFSGCGNTLNCNHPVVRGMVIDCLRYWAAEYHIDGFRFDLAAILGRDQNGAPLANPPLIESLAHDPILARCKLVAEAWDAGGLYQVGSFPNYGRWGEWNGKYRDDLRKVLIGAEGMGALAQRLQGSPDLYWYRGATASINFITCHDGFTLCDLVSYNGKHNEDNGENNNDGANDNNSWNCGAEGPTSDPEINALRSRQMRNALTLLLVSQGVPMILSGDEVARSQNGNNNAYCHDNALSWFDWTLVEKNAGLLAFTRTLIAFRKAHPVLRRRHHFVHRDDAQVGLPDISFHGTQAWRPEWAGWSRALAVLLCGAYAPGGADDDVYLAVNTYWEGLWFDLPQPRPGRRWHAVINTGLPSPEDAHPLGQEPLLTDQAHMLLGPRSVVLLVGR
ncbi:glycogen debranching protein GlgX [Pararhodospirillum photometricum]|uniref:Pullulanase PulA and related glycosidase n=1 Tax=Pararhodospirillum photometricum DSM 122 TaxID=1150469 RepID=H6SNC1_PARPM|nr:glycogen debranching protein GlgX [Pararhodospirillum photometricum]CCG06997.1 Pullulanase PulA and related glycosidase [Pararhodospirillum photometricum DSM 122]